jgi:hypothetical protein
MLAQSGLANLAVAGLLPANSPVSSSTPRKGVVLMSMSWIEGAAEAARCAVHGSDRRERMDEVPPEPWRNAALAVITYLADNPLAECHCPDCLRLFVEEARTDVPASLG